MISKSLTIVILLAIVTIISSPSSSLPDLSPIVFDNRSHDLIVGSRLPGDRLVSEQFIFKSGIWSQIVELQQIYSVGKYRTITLLQALDQQNDGTGAFPIIIEGGPGTSGVVLTFKSQEGEGIDFLVQIFAR